MVLGKIFMKHFISYYTSYTSIRMYDIFIAEVVRYSLASKQTVCAENYQKYNVIQTQYLLLNFI